MNIEFNKIECRKELVQFFINGTQDQQKQILDYEHEKLSALEKQDQEMRLDKPSLKTIKQMDLILYLETAV